MTLDIMQTPMREIMADGLERDKKELDRYKFDGEEKFRQQLFNYVFLRDVYKTRPISYKSMQGLLDGTIKKQTDLKHANEEVTIVFKEIEEGILIDAFFINTDK